MEQFIQDTGLTAADLELNYDDVVEMFGNGQLAMYFGSSAGVGMFQEQGIDATFLPIFSQNGEKWLMTTPYFQVALNRDLEQDPTRREKAMQILHVMLSEDAQEQILAEGQDLLSYSQSVSYHLTDTMKDVRSVVEENHMYIRIASNDFFAISQDVVSKMIAGEYDAEQAYRVFNAQLLAGEKPDTSDVVLTSETAYSNAVSYTHLDYPYGCPDARDERLRCGKSDTKDGRPPKGEYPHCRDDGKRLFRGQTSGTGCRDERPYRKADRYEHSCVDPAEIPLMRTESRRI